MSVRTLLSDHRGDTIIEVVIAIVIVSMVLTGAYVSSSASLDLITSAQQHTDAVGVAQNQVEDLRAKIADVVGSGLAATGVTFCFDSNNSPATYAAGICTISGYTAKITSLGNSNGVGTYGFRINVSWSSSTGDIGQVTINYRVGS